MIDKPAILSSILPENLPVFPLQGAVLFPRGHLPLNIFEPRYLSMIEDALGQGRMIGLAQPTSEGVDPAPLYKVGCLGRLVSFAETDDGRYLVDLLGVCRFKIAEELPETRGYRRVRPVWDDFLADMGPPETPDFDHGRLVTALQTFLKIQGLATDWALMQNAVGEEMLSMLAMACPLLPNEKQALLEAPSVRARADLLTTLLEMACLRQEGDGEGLRH